MPIILFAHFLVTPNIHNMAVFSFSNPENISTPEGISQIIVSIKKEGIYIPLQMTLLLKNLNALNKMAKKAGLGNIIGAMLYNPIFKLPSK